MGHLGTTASAHLLGDCDTLLIVGSNDPWTEFYPAPGPGPGRADRHRRTQARQPYPIEVGLAGDAAETLRALLAAAGGSGPTAAWRADVEEQRARLAAASPPSARGARRPTR